MKKPTIKDVAKELNVSISSVSRAFNNKYDIKKETREHILRVASEMGYSPNPLAQKLKQSKTFNIGVVVPEFINEYYAEVIIGIQGLLDQKGYQILIMQSSNNYKIELANVKTLLNNRVDGLIICPAHESENMNFYLSEVEKGYPIVFLNRVKKSLPAKKVLFNNIKWSFLATEHLVNEGYKKIYHLAGKANMCITNDRIQGFIRAMEKYSFPIGNYKVIETGIFPEDARKVVQKLIFENDLPEAFMCVNDLIALSVINQLEENLIKVPDEIGVIGFTETKMASLMSPKLSSVKQPTYEMGYKAAELLSKLIDNEIITDDTVILNGSLNIRKSSTKISKI